MKKENRSIQFKNYAEGVGAATVPIGIGVIGVGAYFGMKWIAAGLGDLDLLNTPITSWWERRKASGRAQVERGKELKGEDSKGTWSFLDYIRGVTVGSTEKEDDGSLKEWWNDTF